MNFFHPLLQSLQFLRFNFSNEGKQLTHNLFKESDIKQEEGEPHVNSECLLNLMTQQELIKRQLELSGHAKTEQSDAPKGVSKKISKKTNNCGHPDKEHYAKGMCNNCYHRFGRNKQPWLCGHKKLYACGLCQNCYINQYNRKRRVEGHQESEEPQPQ